MCIEDYNEKIIETFYKFLLKFLQKEIFTKKKTLIIMIVEIRYFNKRFATRTLIKVFRNTVRKEKV